MIPVPSLPPPLDRHRATFEGAVRPCLKLIAGRSSSGRTWIGGRPLRAPGFQWPWSPLRPMSFVGQLDLSELHRIGADLLPEMPRRGLLQLFYDVEEMRWGFSPDDRSFFSVRIVGESFGEEAPPLGTKEFAKRTLLPMRGLSVPHIADLELPSPVANDCDAHLPWHQTRRQFTLGANRDHQTFGHADWLQGDARMEAELVQRGFDCGRAYPDPVPAEARRGAREWELLWQIPSDGSAGFRWDDGGALFLLFRREDLARGDLRNGHLILQCT